ncbi:MAG: prealbumin-like fold domain-containing protein, partial [Thermoproteota archaeon]|nr:prealbumin-like fold domain-containing protein [Thermoproteota archaeon]
MLRYRIAVIASIIALTVVITSLFILPQGENILRIPAASSSDEVKLTMVSVWGNSLVDQPKYIISPDPFGNFDNYTVQDGEEADEDSTGGFVKISGLPDGRYTRRQVEASSLYQADILPKIVEIKNQNRNGVAT